jgi:hypothetical protein
VRSDGRALENTVMSHRVPYSVGKLLSSCVHDGFSQELSSVKLVRRNVGGLHPTAWHLKPKGCNL